MATKKQTANAKKTKAKATSNKSVSASESAKNLKNYLIKRAKSTGWMAVLESILVGILGVILITNPTGILKVIFYVVGLFLVVKGVYKIINYFAVHGKSDFYNNDLLYGVIALIFGVLAMVLWEKLGGVIGIVVGAWMIYGALVRMNTAIKLHAAGVSQWIYVLILSLVMLAIGVYMIINVGAVLTLIGWMMLIAAVIGIIDDIIFMQHLDAITKDNK